MLSSARQVKVSLISQAGFEDGLGSRGRGPADDWRDAESAGTGSHETAARRILRGPAHAALLVDRRRACKGVRVCVGAFACLVVQACLPSPSGGLGRRRPDVVRCPINAVE